MTLCEACRDINYAQLQEGYTHLQDARQLRRSAETCPLCAMLRASLNQNTSKEVGNAYEDLFYKEDLSDAPIVLYGVFREDEDKAGINTSQLRGLIGFDVHVSLTGDELDIGNVSLFAYPDSYAVRSGTIVGRPLLKSADSNEAMELVEYWLQDCVYNHPKCNERWDDSDGLPRLPTRVLDVSPENCIRLVVSHGMCGQYAALSHCWGAKPLLRTTSMSIEAHQIGIDFQDLPRTFQDAVRVTRILGLNYIWIDSLCIIQDDRNDWEKEAVMMGSVYEGAYLTIAATGGANGSAGCFIPRPTMPEPVPFPFKLGEQGPAEVIHAALPPAAVVGDLQMNPLAERAWITQEWLLSRRTIHFTKGHLIWVCRTVGETENGEIFVDTSGTQRIHDALSGFRGNESIQSSAPDFLEEWSDFASTYCRRNLTYPSDKPIALEGVVRIIAFQTKDTYHYGIWDRSAHQQLFWFAQDIISRPAELKEMPSWSWISTIGRIKYHVPAATADLLRITSPEDGLTSMASVRIEGKQLLIWAPITSPLQLQGPFNLETPQLANIQGIYMGKAFFETATVPSFHFYGMHDETGKPAGWISFDEGQAPEEPIRCVHVSKSIRGDGQNNRSNFIACKEFQIGHRKFWCRVGMGEFLHALQLRDSQWVYIVVE